jgi:hypothetical protein
VFAQHTGWPRGSQQFRVHVWAMNGRSHQRYRAVSGYPGLPGVPCPILPHKAQWQGMGRRWCAGSPSVKMVQRRVRLSSKAGQSLR